FALNKQDAQRKEIARRLDSEGVRVQAEVVGLSANKFRGAKTYSFDVGVVFFDGDYKAVRTSVPVEPDFGQSIRDNQINKIDVKYLPDDPKVAKSVSGALKESLLMMILAATGIGIGFLIGGVTFLRLRPNKSPGPIGPL
ncbi:hypothetical protein, partial [Chitinimonas sp.]|uniref:hypothetical protein n=1 Tax=Chitinimonas sp. TaxID=1934313 RepID=UPI0035B001DC